MKKMKVETPIMVQPIHSLLLTKSKTDTIIIKLLILKYI